MEPIAHIRTDFPEKFGIPRQSGLVDGLEGRIVFEPKFRHPDAVRGLEQFSHIWILWQFSENEKAGWSFTVRPPYRSAGKVPCAEIKPSAERTRPQGCISAPFVPKGLLRVPALGSFFQKLLCWLARQGKP